MPLGDNWKRNSRRRGFSDDRFEGHCDDSILGIPYWLLILVPAESAEKNSALRRFESKTNQVNPVILRIRVQTTTLILVPAESAEKKCRSARI
jgi:hypothetical protein